MVWDTVVIVELCNERKLYTNKAELYLVVGGLVANY